MTDIAIAFTLITALFAVVLTIKKQISLPVCAICAAVSGTWVTLLLLRTLQVVVDPVLLGLLMGQSVVGIFYLAEKHVPQSWLLFRLPFLLSLGLIAYTALSPSFELWTAYLFVTVLWLVFASIYAFQSSPTVAHTVKQIIDCCKNW